MNAVLFVLLSSKKVQILKTVQIRPILSSSQPIRLQIFFRDSDKTVYYKMRQILLQNASGFLLQNATFMTNCNSTHLFLITPLEGCLCKLLLIFANLTQRAPSWILQQSYIRLWNFLLISVAAALMSLAT